MRKLNPKLFVGPMSKNIVDSVIEYCEENNVSIVNICNDVAICSAMR